MNELKTEQFPITLSLPFNFTDEEGRTFNVGYDREKSLILSRVQDGRAMVIRECTLDEARKWFTNAKGNKT